MRVTAVNGKLFALPAYTIPKFDMFAFFTLRIDCPDVQNLDAVFPAPHEFKYTSYFHYIVIAVLSRPLRIFDQALR